MKTVLTGLATALLLLAASAGPLAAQTEAPPDTEPLAEIATALARIADVLERQLEGSRLELLMKRVEVGETRVRGLAGQLETARREYDQALDFQTRLETQIEGLEQNAGTSDAEAESARNQIEYLRNELGLSRPRLARFEQRVAELEQEVAARRREAEDWQAYLDRELSALP